MEQYEIKEGALLRTQSGSKAGFAGAGIIVTLDGTKQIFNGLEYRRIGTANGSWYVGKYVEYKDLTLVTSEPEPPQPGVDVPFTLTVAGFEPYSGVLKRV